MISASSRLRLPAALWVLLALVVASVGCAKPGPDEGPLWADASELRFDLAHPQLSVEIHNRSGLGRSITDFTLAGEDWDTLRFVDESLPRTVPAHSSVVIPLEISTAAYRIEPGVYRSGSASLRFRSTAYDYEVPIRFVPPEATRPRAGPALALLGVWAALLIGLAGTALRASPSGGARTIASAAGCMAALLTLAATIPLGFGWCSGRLAQAVGPRELDQCRDYNGGHPLEALAASPSLVWLFVALALVALSSASLRAHLGRSEHARSELALSGVRLLSLASLLAALGYGLAPAEASLTGLSIAQAAPFPLGRLMVPRWGLLAQPLGFALGLLALTSLSPSTDEDTPVERIVVRAQCVIWAALLATVYLGGAGLPRISMRPAPLLLHGPQLALELGALAAKTALLVWASGALRRAVDQPERLTLRWLLPLALVHLALVVVWALV